MQGHNWMLPNAMTPNIPITIDESKCVGCNRCVEVCRMDVFLPNPAKGEAPIVMYPDECWFCGVCVEDCPVGANAFHHPLNQIMPWKRKQTGELFREGMTNLPEPRFRDPVDG